MLHLCYGRVQFALPDKSDSHRTETACRHHIGGTSASEL